MPRRSPALLFLGAFALVVALACAPGCASKSEKKPAKPAAPAPTAPAARPASPENLPPVMLGIDVLEANGFKEIAGKKIGLLTHAPGVNRRGEPTWSVLRRAPQSKLVALFAPEHGLDGKISASVNFADSVHAPTGLPVYSVHGKTRKPTKAMLKGLDAVVIDLQDIGSRSYTFASAMLTMMAACFENGVEVIVLDRPNPLGGLKVDGPPLDLEFKSYVGAFRTPYVHGLTLGELARMAKDLPRMMYIPNVMDTPDQARERGRLTVVPMRGWTRAMRWPDTGLRWIPTSPMVPSYEAAVGYAMVGLGTQSSGWSSGIGKDYPFRGIHFPKKTPDEIIRTMERYNILGVRFVKMNGLSRENKVVPGVYVEIVDWEKCRPTEVSFYMQKQAALWSPLNPFANLTASEARTFNIHVGSAAWYEALRKQGGRVDVPLFLKNWQERAAVFQQQAKKYWLYP
jgi:uncharacterized protein YbbC (DUF1343 family)